MCVCRSVLEKCPLLAIREKSKGDEKEDTEGVLEEAMGSTDITEGEGIKPATLTVSTIVSLVLCSIS